MEAEQLGDVRMRGFLRRDEVSHVQALIRARTAPLAAERVPLADAAGRVLAREVRSEVNVPPFVRSAMDGYALRGEETFGAGAYNPLAFKVVGEVMPGQFFPRPAGPGEAVRIMTGAPLPEGTDAVLMAEYARERNGIVTADEPVPPGKNVGRIGEDIRAGQALFAPGRRLRPQDLGVLASIGKSAAHVHRRPRVALLITGNELLKPGERPAGAKIVDSNSVMLAALVRRDGGDVMRIDHLPDERERIRRALRDSDADLVVITGGSSVGVEDHAPTLLAEEGELLAHGVAMRPSAPTGLGAIGARLVFLLPGNPVSCLAAYDFFVGLAVRRLAGLPEGWCYRRTRFPLRDRIASQIGRVDYARVRIENGHAALLATSGASVLSSTTRADGFVVVPQDSEGMPAGAEVDVWLYDPPAELP
jgi:molybdopterin molybdotransferase